MGYSRPLRFGPVALTNTLTTNIANPPTLTGGVGQANAPTNTYFVAPHQRCEQDQCRAYVLAVSRCDGRKCGGLKVIGSGRSVPAFDSYESYGYLRMDDTDFLVGGADTNTALTITVEGDLFIRSFWNAQRSRVSSDSEPAGSPENNSLDFFRGLVWARLTQRETLLGRRPFFILTLPRSRSEWLSAFLSYKGAIIGHDTAVNCDSVGDFLAAVSMMRGTVKSGAVIAWKQLVATFPHSVFIAVHRPVHEVLISLEKLGVPARYSELYDRAKMLEEFSNYPGMKSCGFNSLNRDRVRREIFEACLGVQYDPAWSDKMGARISGLMLRPAWRCCRSAGRCSQSSKASSRRADNRGREARAILRPMRSR